MATDNKQAQDTSKELTTTVMARIEELNKIDRLVFPANYSPQNAIMAAHIIIQALENKDGKPALEVCTKNSVVNSLMQMVVDGLTPLKKQGYYIVRGNQLCWQKSVFGWEAMAKRAGAKDITGSCIYKGDKLKYRIVNGRKEIISHEQEFENVDPKNIVGAYGLLLRPDGVVECTLFDIQRIRTSWSKSSSNVNRDGSVHNTFTEEMCLKTVIIHVCKHFVNSSDDRYLFDDDDDDDVVGESVSSQNNSDSEKMQPLPPVETEYRDISGEQGDQKNEEKKTDPVPETASELKNDSGEKSEPDTKKPVTDDDLFDQHLRSQEATPSGDKKEPGNEEYPF